MSKRCLKSLNNGLHYSSFKQAAPSIVLSQKTSPHPVNITDEFVSLIVENGIVKGYKVVKSLVWMHRGWMRGHGRSAAYQHVSSPDCRQQWFTWTEPFTDSLEPGQTSGLMITAYVCAQGPFFTTDLMEIMLWKVKGWIVFFAFCSRSASILHC